ncbi:hypothetical protein [Massilia sp. CF038]|nr:hypothetical protein [Massilia sp. CF038]SHG95526.1 hypothetical protein SAMN05428948_2048 [Massilia sp. CF038]
MKSTIFKVTAALALAATSVAALAGTHDCCGGIECCIRMLSCCF